MSSFSSTLQGLYAQCAREEGGDVSGDDQRVRVGDESDLGIADDAGVFHGAVDPGGRWADADGLRGSVGRYFPYGEEETVPPSGNDAVKFATYTRESVSGLDYADQRNYVAGQGRFSGVDRYRASARSANPPSWNRYTYVLGDPVGLIDPTGRDFCIPLDIGDLCIADAQVVEVTAVQDELAAEAAGDSGDINLSPNSPSGRLKKTSTIVVYGQMLDASLARAIQLLRGSTDCLSLFNVAYGSPVSLLASLANDGDIGFGPTDSTNAAETIGFVGLPSPAYPTGQQTGIITINSAVFSVETTIEQVQMIIHELGHVFYIIYGAGSTVITPDSTMLGSVAYSDAASNANAALVEQKCK